MYLKNIYFLYQIIYLVRNYPFFKEIFINYNFFKIFSLILNFFPLKINYLILILIKKCNYLYQNLIFIINLKL